MGVGMACGDETECGPTEAVVVRVYDGDTIELDSGERVRYLLVDTPELTGDPECYATEATQFNRTLVEGKTVQLSYDAQCTDRYDRLLAYISINGASVNERLISQGYACVLQIPPNGEDRAAAYRQLQTDAQADLVGLWGTCAEVPC
ncbi:MAG: thermonuclease family protein [Deltaproteobacteria bacterium]|nr:thermonuclease family protein [Deltaproteobacteria bacterium]